MSTLRTLSTVHFSAPRPHPQPRLRAPVRHITMSLFQRRRSYALSSTTSFQTATYGRNLTWGSAYILIISRVIGSGIFATPGLIAKSVGSVGLTLLLWIVGAAISACGLAVLLEYGCML